MNNEQLVKQIDEFMELNRQCRQDGNDLLNKLRGILTKSGSDEYNKGLNDAWDLAQRIGSCEHPEMYHCTELAIIFGFRTPSDVFDKYTYQQALEKIEEYEKKKAEEEAKPVRGDIVRFYIGSSVYNAIFLCEDQHEQCYWVLKENEEFPQRLSKKNFSLVKTGKHVDLDNLFKESRNDETRS